jgi:hypothetical protein
MVEMEYYAKCPGSGHRTYLVRTASINEVFLVPTFEVKRAQEFMGFCGLEAIDKFCLPDKALCWQE